MRKLYNKVKPHLGITIELIILIGLYFFGSSVQRIIPSDLWYAAGWWTAIITVYIVQLYSNKLNG